MLHSALQFLNSVDFAGEGLRKCFLPNCGHTLAYFQNHALTSFLPPLQNPEYFPRPRFPFFTRNLKNMKRKPECFNAFDMAYSLDITPSNSNLFLSHQHFFIGKCFGDLDALKIT